MQKVNGMCRTIANEVHAETIIPVNGYDITIHNTYSQGAERQYGIMTDSDLKVCVQGTYAKDTINERIFGTRIVKTTDATVKQAINWCMENKI